MKKTIYILFALFIGQRSVAQQAYLGVTLSQDILALTAAPFGGTLTDEQLKEGLHAELVAMYSIYSRTMNYGCPTQKDSIVSEGATKLYDGKIVLVELEGDCPYGQKVAKVEAQGAIAVVLLQKEKSEKFNLQVDEYAKQCKIPCFILRDFDENTRLFRFAPSPALLYIAAEGHGKAAQTVPQNQHIITQEQRMADIVVAASPSLQVAPNPAADVLNISYQIPSETASFRMIDMIGKEIIQNTLNQSVATFSIEVAHLPAGVYMVDIQYSAGRIAKQVLIR
jgi:Secretion system C-terminal sorting domain/PA domain